MIVLKVFFHLLLIFSLCACKDDKQNSHVPNDISVKKVILKYAKGFSISASNGYSILNINTPWPNATKAYKYAIIDKENQSKITINPKDFDGILTTPIEKIVVTSTTHLPALELLRVENSLVGFPGTNYISSNVIRKQIDLGNIKELGQNETLNTENLLNLNPDVVIGFGIEGGNKSFETLKKSGIPVIYNGDWAEQSPLAKAEWIKLFGVIYNKEIQADSIFNIIEKDYLAAKTIAQKVTKKPSVLSGAMHNDIWFLPNGSSTEAQILRDANVNYLWNDTSGTGSIKLNFESVFIKAKNAEIWLNPSNYSSLNALKNGNKNHAVFDAFKNKEVYSFANTKGTTGGVLYYELGLARPDLVLKDVIKICHPQLLEGYNPYFFKKLN